MRRTPFLPFVLIAPYLLCSSGCNDMKAHPDKEFAQAKSIVIGYTIQGKKKQFTVTVPEEVAAIIRTLSTVDKVDAGDILKLSDHNTVTFIVNGKPSDSFTFAKPTFVYRRGWGTLYMKDTSFFDAITAAVTKEEKRNINILRRDNDP